MHIAVFADFEGAFGVWRMRQCHNGTPEWQYGRECLTADVNHVIAGAFDGGAKRVTVKDTHATGFNILTDRLDRRARYHGGHHVTPTFFGDVSQYDLILYVGIHAASGTDGAFFPHTHYGIFSEVRINGRAVCEMDVYGSYLGAHGVPIGFVSGEDVAVEQALKALPWAKSVVVDKHQEAYTAGQKSEQYLFDGRAELRRVAAEAVRDAGQMQPLVLEGPLHFEAEFRKLELAQHFNTWGFDQTDRTVSWQADEIIDGFNKFNQLVFFPKRQYPIRKPLLFVFRNLFRVKARYFAPKPNDEGAVRAALTPESS